MKKINISIMAMSILALITSLFLFPKNLSFKSIANGTNIEEDTCALPINHKEIDTCIKEAYDSISFTNFTTDNLSTSETYTTLGTITRINKRTYNNYLNIYIQRINPSNRVKSGILIYDYHNDEGLSLNVGNVISVTGNITFYKGEVEITNSSISLLSETNTYGNPTAEEIDNHSFSSFSMYDLSTLVKISDVNILSTGSSVSNDNSSSYMTINKNNESVGIMIDTKNTTTTNEIVEYLNSYSSTDTTFNIVGNLKYASSEYKLSIGSIDDITMNEKQNENKTFEIFNFNDLHGTIEDSDSTAGIERISTYIKNVKSTNENTIVLSTGDMYQGGGVSNITKGLLVTDWMNELEFTSLTIGNHEFDWGVDAIYENINQADFPFLGINVYSRDTSSKVDWLDSSTTIIKDGIKFGIIGSIGDCYNSILNSRVKDYYFVVGDELTTLVKNEATRLRNEENCQFIIYGTHADYSEYDVSLSDGYVDLVFEGHSHQNYVNTDANNVIHLQTGGYDKQISNVSLSYSSSSNSFTFTKYENIATSELLTYEKDTATTNIFVSYKDITDQLYEVIGTNSTLRNSTFLCQLVASLYLEKGLEKWNDNYDIFLAGGYLAARSPYNLEAGDVTLNDLYALFPFDNDIVLCSISGSKLKSRFLTSVSNYYVSLSDYGNLNKDSVSDSETYYIITDTYSSEYTYNGLTYIDTYSLSGYYARDALYDYIRSGGLMS
ncbi:MAG: bifunctional metallophosphatase/5'-nucleotidase [Bacilli bacterium]